MTDWMWQQAFEMDPDGVIKRDLELYPINKETPVADSNGDDKYGATVNFPIFDNTYKKGKQPDRRGQIEMSKALLTEIVEAAKAGDQPLLQVAVWNNTSKKDGTPYLYCRMSLDRYSMDKAKEGDTTPEAPAEESSEPEEEGDGDIF